MAIRTLFICDQCSKEFDLTNQAMPGVEEVLQLTDSMGVKICFCGTKCLLKYLESYTCPYKDLKLKGEEN